MDDIVREAAVSFNIKLYGYSRSKAVFLLDTDLGAMILKRQPDARKIDALYRITEDLHSAGFNSAERYLVADGRPYAAIKDGIYTVSMCGSGERCCLSDQGHALAIAKAIARLHSASADISLTDVKKSEEIGIKYYTKRIAEAKHIKKWLGRQSRLTDIDVLFVKKYDEYLNKAIEASGSILEAERFDNPSLCFGKIKEDNIFIDNNNNVTLLNFENCTLSAPVTDLCQLIRRFVKRGGNGVFIPQIIRAYSDERTLSAKDMEFLKAFLSFPHKFCSLTSRYYNGKKVYGGSHQLMRLKADIAHQEKIYEILNTI